MSGAHSRRKGHNWERELVRRFREAMPGAEGIKRGLQSRGGGKEEADVIVPHFHVEAKCGKRPNHRAALEQAIGDAARGKIPIAVCKDDRKEPTVTMRLDDLLWLVKTWWWFESRGNPPKEVAWEKPDAEAACAALDEREEGI
jgi:hypothetical protein